MMRDVREIATQRLRLRPLELADAPRVAKLCGEPAVARMLASAPLPYLPIAAEGWIMTLKARAPRGQDFVFACELAGEGLIGAIGAHKAGEGFELGYWFGRPYWGKGFASEALAGFLAAARELGRLEAGHFVDNPASGRVLQKGGFAYTGETVAMFSLARGASAPCKRMRHAGDGVRPEAFETALAS